MRGVGGVRIEDSLVLTKNGNSNFTPTPCVECPALLRRVQVFLVPTPKILVWGLAGRVYCPAVKVWGFTESVPKHLIML